MAQRKRKGLTHASGSSSFRRTTRCGYGIHLKPGERVGFHRHVLNYFWSAATAGRGRQHFNDGEMREYTYAAGETRHETYGSGEYKVHDLQNIGDTDLISVTVEFKDSPNKPMPLPTEASPSRRTLGTVIALFLEKARHSEVITIISE
jgi:hypothetical protein